MNRKLLVYLFLPLLVSTISCRDETNTNNTSQIIIDSGATGNDYRTQKIVDRGYPMDTLLGSGWQLKYYTKNDETKSSDLYLECSKLNKKFIYPALDVLQLRRYFIPTYIGESDNCIYFSTACGTSCQSLLIFYKNRNPRFEQFDSVIEYNIANDLVVFLPEKAARASKLTVLIANLGKHLIKTTRFRNSCNVLPKEGCVDSVNFSKKEVKIYARLNKGQNYKENIILEKNIVETGN